MKSKYVLSEKIFS